MKVVLFCGGLGMRMREYSENVPKPLVTLGTRPILWHVMKYYSHYGHRDFILCLGYRGEAIKNYFLNYDECISNDFVLSDGGRRVDLLRRDIEDWRITFVETGLAANVGERLMAVRPFVADEEAFLANYSDGLTDCPLPTIVDSFHASGSVATFMIARPNLSLHFVGRNESGLVTGLRDVRESDVWINAGYFVLRRDVFDYIRPGEELVLNPFARLIDCGRLNGVQHNGFWRGIDTFKDLQALDSLIANGPAPWEVWRRPDEVSAGAAALTAAAGEPREASNLRSWPRRSTAEPAVAAGSDRQPARPRS